MTEDEKELSELSEKEPIISGDETPQLETLADEDAIIENSADILQESSSEHQNINEPILQNEVSQNIIDDTTSIDNKQDNRRKLNAIGKIALPLLSVLLVNIFPVLYLYFNNVAVAQFSEIFVPMGMFCAVGLVLLGLFLLVFPSHSLAKAAFAACVASFFFQNYALIETGLVKLFSGMKFWHLAPILFVLVLFLVVLIQQKIKPADAQKINAAFCAVFAALILVNFVTAIPKLASNTSQKLEKEAVAAGTANSSGLPNVYWLIFDEFSAPKPMKKYYDYDTSPFTNKLEDLGFSVNYSCINDSTSSATIIGNYALLEYKINADMPVFERQQQWLNPPILQLAQKNGYEIMPVNLASKFGFPSVVGGTSSGGSNTVDGTTFTRLLLQQTVIKDFLPNITNADINAITASLDYLQSPKIVPSKQGFTVSYMVAPHQPFYFTAEGKLNNPSAFHDWKDKSNYLGYYIYISKQIEKIVENIVENDPDSVIVLQSDHSARYLVDENDKRIIERIDRINAFGAVYYRGEALEIEGLSGVNTLRAVFSKLYNIDLPELPMPNAAAEVTTDE